MRAISFYTEEGRLVSKPAEVEFRNDILIVRTESVTYEFRLNSKDNRKFEYQTPVFNDYLMIVDQNTLIGEYDEYYTNQWYKGLWKIEIQN